MNKDILCYANMCITAQAMIYGPGVSYVYVYVGFLRKRRYTIREIKKIKYKRRIEYNGKIKNRGKWSSSLLLLENTKIKTLNYNFTYELEFAGHALF